MGRRVMLETIGEAARRATRVADGSAARREWSGAPVRSVPVAGGGLLRSLAVRGSIAVLVAVLLVTVSVTSARAQNPFAAAQVVAQMSTLIGKLATIKEAVNEQRDNARTAFFGQIAPLASKLSTVNCFLAHVNGLSLGFAECLDTGTPNPLRYELPNRQAMLDHVAFNRPADVCVAQTGVNCYDEPITAAEVRSVGDVVRNITRAAYTADNGVYPQHAADRHARQAGGFDDIADSLAAQDEGFERRMARQRAVVEGGMSVVEEWRGCQPVLDGGVADANDPRLPCVTNRGAGRDAAAGTVGMVQELAAQLKLIQDAQRGDASQNQLDTISTQVGIMRARISAAMLELQAVGAEAGQQAQVQAEASQRRRQELFRLRMDCLDGRMGPPADPFNVFYPTVTGAAGGTCIGPPPPTS